MKLTNEQFKQFVLSEAKKIATEEGWIVNTTNRLEKKELFENSNININTEADKVELGEVKMLAEEVKRMKELVDFRSPLLKKD